MVNWESGKRLELERNPYYFGGEESQADFDRLNFLIVPDREEALRRLADGSCDVLDKSYHLEALPKEGTCKSSQVLLGLGRRFGAGNVVSKT